MTGLLLYFCDLFYWLVYSNDMLAGVKIVYSNSAIF